MATKAAVSESSILDSLLPMLRDLGTKKTTSNTGSANTGPLEQMFALMNPDRVAGQAREGVNYQTDRLLQGALGKYINTVNQGGGYGGTNAYLSQLIADTAGQGAALETDTRLKAGVTATNAATGIANATRRTTQVDGTRVSGNPMNSLLLAAAGYGLKKLDPIDAIKKKLKGVGTKGATSEFDYSRDGVGAEIIGNPSAGSLGAGSLGGGLNYSDTGVGAESMFQSSGNSSLSADYSSISSEAFRSYSPDVFDGASGFDNNTFSPYAFDSLGMTSESADLAAAYGADIFSPYAFDGAGLAAEGADLAAAYGDFGDFGDFGSAGVPYSQIVNVLAGGDVTDAAESAIGSYIGSAGGPVGAIVGSQIAPSIFEAGSDFVQDVGDMSSIVCYELVRTGEMSKHLADVSAAYSINLPRAVVRGYHGMCPLLLRLMRKYSTFRSFMRTMAVARSLELVKGNKLGLVVRMIFEPACWILGHTVYRKAQLKLNFAELLGVS